MNYLLLGLDVALLFLVWPVNRWVMKRGGRVPLLGGIARFPVYRDATVTRRAVHLRFQRPAWRASPGL